MEASPGTDYCARCRRPVPAPESDEYGYWDAESNGQTMIRPGCLPADEQQAIDEDMSQPESRPTSLLRRSLNPRSDMEQNVKGPARSAKAWVRDLGYLPVEVIRACPILPRWGFAGNTRNTILLAAFLGQAIVLRGHHLDLKQGTELLDELAHFINGLGPVTWSNMTNISRRNYVSRTEGNTIRITPLASKLMVHLAEEHATLLIEDPAAPS